MLRYYTVHKNKFSAAQIKHEFWISCTTQLGASASHNSLVARAYSEKISVILYGEFEKLFLKNEVWYRCLCKQSNLKIGKDRRD